MSTVTTSCMPKVSKYGWDTLLHFGVTFSIALLDVSHVIRTYPIVYEFFYLLLFFRNIFDTCQTSDGAIGHVKLKCVRDRQYHIKKFDTTLVAPNLIICILSWNRWHGSLQMLHQSSMVHEILLAWKKIMDVTSLLSFRECSYLRYWRHVLMLVCIAKIASLLRWRMINCRRSTGLACFQGK